MKKKGCLIIISAPSGTGKTSVIHRLLSKRPDMIHSISSTTRPMRAGEVDGKDYHFMEERAFRDGIDRNEFAEWEEVHDRLYGTPKGPIDRAIAEEKIVLLDLDVKGGTKLRRMYGDRALSIFLVPPDAKELERRLLARRTDSPDVQRLRLKNALEEMKYKDEYDHRVVNDDLDRACLEVERIISESIR